MLLRASAISTSARKPKCPACVGPTHRLQQLLEVVLLKPPKENRPQGRLPAAFLRGKSLLPFLRAGSLNSRSRRRGSRGVHLGKIGLTRSTKLCPES
jgi:hypothetical protein